MIDSLKVFEMSAAADCYSEARHGRKPHVVRSPFELNQPSHYLPKIAFRYYLFIFLFV